MISFCYFYCRIILNLFLYQWEVLEWLCILQYVILSAKSMTNKHFALLSGIVCRRIWYIILPRVAAKLLFVCLWFFVCIFFSLWFSLADYVNWNPLLSIWMLMHSVHHIYFAMSSFSRILVPFLYFYAFSHPSLSLQFVFLYNRELDSGASTECSKLWTIS